MEEVAAAFYSAVKFVLSSLRVETSHKTNTLTHVKVLQFRAFHQNLRENIPEDRVKSQADHPMCSWFKRIYEGYE